MNLRLYKPKLKLTITLYLNAGSTRKARNKNENL